MKKGDTEVRTLTQLVGQTLASVTVEKRNDDKYRKCDQDAVRFEREDGRVLVLTHEQDCCEAVTLDDVNGDVAALIGAPIVVAEERVQELGATSDGTATATFYEIRTARGGVTLRWHGESNGYYSEGVDLRAVVDGRIVSYEEPNDDWTAARED